MGETAAKSSRPLDLILFLVSLAVLVFLLMFYNEWFWLALPSTLTYLVRWLDVI